MKSHTTSSRVNRLNEALHKFNSAKCPEDVFGDNPDIRKSYRELAALVHPDPWIDGHKKIAEEAFKRLGEWHIEAQKKIERGTYGDRKAMVEVVITTKKESYTVDGRLASGDMCEIYTARAKSGKGVIVKVPRSPANNDLLKNEAAQLHFLQEDAVTKNLSANVHIIKLFDSFELQQGKEKKHINILEPLDGFYTLEEVRTVYPDGLDIRDAAWMWRRLLTALLIPHQAGLIHGGIIPSNVMISPKDHNGKLIDWCYSVKTGSTVKAISAKFKAFYPPEILAKKPVRSNADIYMAAMCMLYLLGGDPVTQTLPTTLHHQIAGVIRACLLGQAKRLSDVAELYDDFGTVLKKLFGIKFREFSMPVRTK